MNCIECNIFICVLYVIDKCEYFVYFFMLLMLNFNKKGKCFCRVMRICSKILIEIVCYICMRIVGNLFLF